MTDIEHCPRCKQLGMWCGQHQIGAYNQPGDGWQPVVFSADCDEDGDCPVCGIDYSDCPCPGPTQDGYEYMERDGVLYARPEKDGAD